MPPQVSAGLHQTHQSAGLKPIPKPKAFRNSKNTLSEHDTFIISPHTKLDPDTTYQQHQGDKPGDDPIEFSPLKANL